VAAASKEVDASIERGYRTSVSAAEAGTAAWPDGASPPGKINYNSPLRKEPRRLAALRSSASIYRSTPGNVLPRPFAISESSMATSGEWQVCHARVAFLLCLLTEKRSAWKSLPVAPTLLGWGTNTRAERCLVSIVHAVTTDKEDHLYQSTEDGYSGLDRIHFVLSKLGAKVSINDLPRYFTPSQKRRGAILERAQSNSAFRGQSQEEVKAILDRLQRALLILVGSLSRTDLRWFMTVAIMHARDINVLQELQHRFASGKLTLNTLARTSQTREAIRLIALVRSKPRNRRMPRTAELTKTPHSSISFHRIVLDALLGPGMDWNTARQPNVVKHLLRLGGTNATSQIRGVSKFLELYVVS
jgi:hypothetical protein